jgi:hypothetical protein
MKTNSGLNKYRLRTGAYKSDDSFGNTGAFQIKVYSTGKFLFLNVISTDGESDGWEHVSVSLPTRCPTWEEMNNIKNLFWGEEETVIQFHPPKSEYVNRHQYTLHLWKNRNQEIILPDKILVG